MLYFADRQSLFEDCTAISSHHSEGDFFFFLRVILLQAVVKAVCGPMKKILLPITSPVLLFP